MSIIELQLEYREVTLVAGCLTSSDMVFKSFNHCIELKAKLFLTWLTKYHVLKKVKKLKLKSQNVNNFFNTLVKNYFTICLSFFNHDIWLSKIKLTLT